MTTPGSQLAHLRARGCVLSVDSSVEGNVTFCINPPVTVAPGNTSSVIEFMALNALLIDGKYYVSYYSTNSGKHPKDGTIITVSKVDDTHLKVSYLSGDNASIITDFGYWDNNTRSVHTTTPSEKSTTQESN